MPHEPREPSERAIASQQGEGEGTCGGQGKGACAHLRKEGSEVHEAAELVDLRQVDIDQEEERDEHVPAARRHKCSTRATLRKGHKCGVPSVRVAMSV